jgi:pilus assembly protein CpaB
VAARIVTLIVALVVAAVGAVLVIAYALQADDRAEARYADVRVVVANQFIPEGTLLEDVVGDDAGATYLSVQPVSESSLIPDAWVDGIPPGQQDLEFRTDVFPGDQMSSAKLGPATGGVDLLGLNPDPAASGEAEDAQGRAGLVLALPDNQRGSSWLQAGATVAVLVDEPTPPEGVSPRTCVLVPDAKIIAVGSQTEPGVGDQASPDPAGEATEVPPGFVVVEVDQTRASELIRAQDGGSLYFVLLADVNAPTFSPGCYTDAQLDSRLGVPAG